MSIRKAPTDFRVSGMAWFDDMPKGFSVWQKAYDLNNAEVLSKIRLGRLGFSQVEIISVRTKKEELWKAASV